MNSVHAGDGGDGADRDDDSYPEVNWDVLHVLKKCVICKQSFTEEQNTGRLGCLQHPGVILNGAFTCCNLGTTAQSLHEFYDKNVSSTKRGCNRCDHRAHLTPFDATNGVARIPPREAMVIGCLKDALEVPTRRPIKYLYVYRYDRVQREKKLCRMRMHFLALNHMADRKYLLKKGTGLGRAIY